MSPPQKPSNCLVRACLSADVLGSQAAQRDTPVVLVARNGIEQSPLGALLWRPRGDPPTSSQKGCRLDERTLARLTPPKRRVSVDGGVPKRKKNGCWLAGCFRLARSKLLNFGSHLGPETRGARVARVALGVLTERSSGEAVWGLNCGGG